MKKISAAALLFSSTAAVADAPNVVTDIAPVYALVAQVMEGVGEPQLLMKQGASPHGYSMRPSEARALQDADLVVWIGEDLTPWLENSVETLAADAVSLELLHAPGTEVLAFRETSVFGTDEDHHDDHDGHDDHDEEHHDDHEDDHHDEEHDDHGHDDHDDHDEHDDHKDEHDDHGHDDHDEHDHDAHDEDKHDDHDDHDEHGHDDHHGHDHDGDDPHAWMDVDNAITWVGVIAASLSDLDPANAATYAANAEKAADALDHIKHDMEHQLEDYKGAHFVVFHDAYQYFEHMTGLKASGALQLSDATPPSAAQLAAVQAEIQEHNITCVFSEPQFSDALVRSVTNGNVNASELDPLGFGLDLGPNLYSDLMKNLANSFESCLK